MNSTTVSKTVLHILEDVVNAHGQEIAISCGDRQLNYNDFNQLANQVAHLVTAAEEQSSEPVALLTAHDLPAAYGAIGILKSGNIYSFLPSGNPSGLNQLILQDLGSRLLLTDDAHSQTAAALAGDGVRVINIEHLPAGRTGKPPALSIEPQDYAGIYFTSGSTGQPKGVIRTHDNFVARYESDQAIHKTGPGDQIALLQGMHFSAGCTNFLGGLLSGATLHLAQPAEMSASSLAKWLLDSRISHLRLLTPLLRQIFDSVPRDRCFSSLRYFRPTGRALSSDIELFARHLPQTCKIAHGLGISEASLPLHVILQRDALPEGGIIPVGTPVGDSVVTLVDEAGEAVPQGKVGLIVVAGRTVAAGYWRRPELTARHFADDPTHPDRRIFYSGDLAKLREDGLYEFVGRKDNQVKVRGFRIELEAVESAMEEQPGVQCAAVRALPDAGGENMLVGYIEAQEGAALTTAELRRRLARELPEYLVPSRLIVLPKLPQGQTGKVDKSALPAPDRSRPELDVPLVSPRTAAELIIAHIWSDLFDLDEIGVNDSFFDLGGQSLMASQIARRIQDRFQITISLADLFKASTIAELAALVDGASEDAGEALEADIDEILRSFGV